MSHMTNWWIFMCPHVRYKWVGYGYTRGYRDIPMPYPRLHGPGTGLYPWVEKCAHTLPTWVWYPRIPVPAVKIAIFRRFIRPNLFRPALSGDSRTEVIASR